MLKAEVIENVAYTLQKFHSQKKPSEVEDKSLFK